MIMLTRSSERIFNPMRYTGSYIEYMTYVQETYVQETYV